MFSRFLSLWVLALALLQPVSAEDTVISGGYLIHLCNSGQPNSEASRLQELLPRMKYGLRKVIADVQLGTASKHGYSAFFKDDSSKVEVLRVYRQIAAGANFVLANKIRRPTFICANPETPLLYQYCLGRPDTALMSWMQTELMPICPHFWSIQQRAFRPDCPLVVRNVLTPNDMRLLGNQEALLVGNLVHLYHRVGPEFITAIADVSDLNASESLLNPPNYALYYAGGYLTFPVLRSTNPADEFLKMAAVQAGCTSFPDMKKSDGELRHLLEIPNNSGDTNVQVPVYFDLPSSVQVPPNLNTMQKFCNDAVYAPNGTVCCDESTGLWIPAPVIRDGPAASLMSASCPQSTGSTGGEGAGTRIINTRRRRTLIA